MIHILQTAAYQYITSHNSSSSDHRYRQEHQQVYITNKVSRKTRSILIPPCSVALLESSLIFSFHSLSEDAEIILYNSANSEMLRIPISRYQRGSEMNIPIDYLEMGSYTLEIVTASGEHWYGYFEYVASDTLSL